ncbi:MAG: serine/threonine protein kinase [Myxococcales bacterium]|nr:serine/threonine protein kinase [Myxococcales bacterium]
MTERKDRHTEAELISSVSDVTTPEIESWVRTDEADQFPNNQKETQDPVAQGGGADHEKRGDYSDAGVDLHDGGESLFDVSGDFARTVRGGPPNIENAEGYWPVMPGDVIARDALQSPIPSRRVGPNLSDKAPQRPRLLADRYQLEELVGRGGMGSVYRATQKPLNRTVAIKVLNPDFQKRDPQFVRRFFFEASATARLVHAHTITVYDYGEADNGELFIAMEYLKGRSLSRVLSIEGSFSMLRTLNISMQICRALREAHMKGIIHRDLKPANILILDDAVDGDFIKVLDFGLAKLFSADQEVALEDEKFGYTELTGAGMFLGSPKYMAPEQIQCGEIGPYTDIYALGNVMYQMISNRPPFVGTGNLDVLHKHMSQIAPTFAELGIRVHPEMEKIVRRCLEKDPRNRYESMTDLLEGIKEVCREIGYFSFVESSFTVEEMIRAGSMNGRLVSSTKADDLVYADRAAVSFLRQTPSSFIISVMAKSPVLFFMFIFVFALLAVSGGGLGMLAYLKVLSQEKEAPLARKAEVNLEVVSHPSGAEVFYQGASIGTTPLQFQVRAEPFDTRIERFLFRSPGYQDAVLDVEIGQVSGVVRGNLTQEEGRESYSKYRLD